MRQLMSLRKPLLLPKQPKRLLKRFPQSNSMAHRDMTLSAGLIGPLLLLTACDSAGGSRGGPGAVSEGEARALDEAAQMLEERRLPEGALPSEATSPTPTDGEAATDNNEAQERAGE